MTNTSVITGKPNRDFAQFISAASTAEYMTNTLGINIKNSS